MTAKTLLAWCFLIVPICGIDVERHSQSVLINEQTAITFSGNASPKNESPPLSVQKLSENRSHLIPPPKPPRTFAYTGPLQANITRQKIPTYKRTKPTERSTTANKETVSVTKQSILERSTMTNSGVITVTERSVFQSREKSTIVKKGAAAKIKTTVKAVKRCAQKVGSYCSDGIKVARRKLNL